MKITMFYFGPWERAGHYLVNEEGRGVYMEDIKPLFRNFPWGDHGYNIDCCLQPTCVYTERDGWRHTSEPLNQAVLHHKGGWTAISFWDRSVDTRGQCNSTYFAEGEFTFDEMVKMAKERFAVRWKKHGEITQYVPPV